VSVCLTVTLLSHYAYYFT